MYSSRAQPESSSDWECLWGSPADGAKGDPFPNSLSEGSSDGTFPPGEGRAGGDMGAFIPPSLVDMPLSGQGQFRQTGLKIIVSIQLNGSVLKLFSVYMVSS